jgi:signal transduction histidine kinase
LALVEAKSVDEVASVAVQHARASLAARHVLFVALDEDAAEASVLGAEGFEPSWPDPPAFARLPDAPMWQAYARQSIVEIGGATRFPILGAIGGPRVRSCVAVPVMSGGHVVAILDLCFVTDRVLHSQERTFLEQLSAEIGRALDRIQRRTVERRDAANAVRSGERSSILADASVALTSSLDLELTLASMARLALPHFGSTCVVDLATPDGLVRFARADAGPSVASPPRRARRLAADHPLSRVLETGDPASGAAGAGQEMDDALDLGDDRPPLRSFLVVPMQVRGQVLGTLSFGSRGERAPYGPEDLDFAQDLAHRAALSIDNARLVEEATRAVRARDDVLAVVSHDLRGYLNVVRTALALLVRSIPADEEESRSRNYCGAIERAADRMNALLGDLLDAAAIESDSLSMVMHPENIGLIAKEAALILQPLAVKGDLTLSLEGTFDDGDPCIAHCDRARMLQVLANLIGNAIKFTNKGGRVAVTITPRHGSVELSVSDTGQGIDPEHLPHVFDRYWKKRGDRRAGTGLGLAIAQAIVRAHGSHILVTSELGKGSRFSFEIAATHASVR